MDSFDDKSAKRIKKVIIFVIHFVNVLKYCQDITEKQKEKY